MKTTLIVGALLVTISAAKKPAFKWIGNRFSKFGIPLLRVAFPDGKHLDYIHFNSFNPIPKQPQERDQDVDPCIFEGYLENEADVYVVLTGGCPLNDSFEIQFKSSLLDEFLFKVVDGNVEIIQSPFKSRDGSCKVPFPDPEQGMNLMEKSKVVAFPESGLVLRLSMTYDATFAARFGANSLNKMRAVVAQTQPMFFWPSLTVRIRLDVITEGNITQSIQANENGLNIVGIQIIDNSIDSNVFLCSQNDQPGIVGISYVGVVCHSNLSFRSAIVEFYESDLATGQIVAHEIGHHLGMGHDFLNNSVFTARHSKNGTSCKVNGVMDYGSSVKRWSICSVEDFQAYFNSYQPFCMAEDTMPITTTSTTVATTTKKTTTIRTTNATQSMTTRKITSPTTKTTKITATPGTTSPLCRCGNFNLVTNPSGRNDSAFQESNRIVGGFVAPPHSIPYQVGIWLNGGKKPFCGGTLISPNYVLTASHCMIYPPFLIKIAVGDVNYLISGDGEVFYQVFYVIRHPDFNPTTLDFDFALAKLATPVRISSISNYACLPPDASQNFDRASLVVSGWGGSSAGGSLSGPLRAAYVTAISSPICFYYNLICATMNPVNTDNCQGDSGGPLAGLVNGKVTLVGITSFGFGCTQTSFLSVYIRVAAQKDWILANSDAGNCQN